MIGSIASLVIAMAQAAAPAPTPAPAGPRLDVKAVVAEVQKRYDGAADFRARFTQTLTSTALGRKTSSSGEVTFKKPGRMRWDYEKPDKSSYVTDGGVLWLYEPDDKQAFKQDLKSSQLPAALSFLTGKGKLAAEFDITFAGNKPGPDYVLSLSPKAPQAQVKTIQFVVDPRTYDVRESVITDGQGNINDLTFADIRVNTRVPDALFKFTPPAGTRVIDTAKLGK
ncbi:MAG TPA: outer membrane lipoprotein chaperone LolA [Polyangia bacterium]